MSVRRADGSAWSTSSSFLKYSLATDVSVGIVRSAGMTGLFPLVVFGDLRLVALVFREGARFERRELVEVFRTKVGVPDLEPPGLAKLLGLRGPAGILVPGEFDGR